MKQLEALYNNSLVRLSFEPFLPSDNDIRDDDEFYLETIGQSLQELLRLKFDVFLSQMAYNKSFNDFLDAYFAYRSRKFQIMNSSIILDAIDRLIFLIEFRLVSNTELQLLLDKDILKLKSMSNIEESYKLLLQSESQLLKNLYLPRVMDVCSILNDTRISLARQYMIKVTSIRPCILLQDMIDLSKAMEDLSKKLILTMESDKKMIDLDEYVADICCSISYFFKASQDLLQGSALLKNGGETVSFIGVGLLNSLRCIYEEILPKLAASKAQNIYLKAAQTACISCVLELAKDHNSDENQSDINENDTIIALAALMESLIEDDNNNNQDIQWFDLLMALSVGGDARKNINNSNMQDDIECVGAFVADCLRSPEQRVIRRRLEKEGLDADYLCQSFAAQTGLDSFMNNARSAGIIPSEDWTAQIPIKDDCNSIDNSGRANTIDEGIEALKNVFPDYGRGFLYACLVFYEGYINRIVDAIFNDTLPPSLINMDRTVVAVSRGKGGLRGVAQSRVNIDGKEVFDLVDDIEIRKQNKERVRLDHIQRERDAGIIAQEYKDYEDDYDDQYDDGMVGRSESTSDWKARMDTVRRFNYLLRAEEDEIAFWEGMKNKNFDQAVVINSKKKVKSGKLDHEEEQEEQSNIGERNANGKDPEKEKSGGGRGGNAAGAGRGTTGGRSGRGGRTGRGGGRGRGRGSGGDPTAGTFNGKPRTKNHDKHHQRDRALKKISRGMV